jgi:hypothetical protein
MNTVNVIDISFSELETLMKWISKMDPKPIVIKLQGTHTGIGMDIRAEVDNGEGEGVYKDISDYAEW